jgi:N-acetylneuraminic acid mutarotase
VENIIKNGKEILDEFFNDLAKIKSVDEKIVAEVKKLYFEKKLTNVYLTNALTSLRDKENDKN